MLPPPRHHWLGRHRPLLAGLALDGCHFQHGLLLALYLLLGRHEILEADVVLVALN